MALERADFAKTYYWKVVETVLTNCEYNKVTNTLQAKCKLSFMFCHMSKKTYERDWLTNEGASSVGRCVLFPIVLDSSQEFYSTPPSLCMHLGSSRNLVASTISWATLYLHKNCNRIPSFPAAQMPHGSKLRLDSRVACNCLRLLFY